MERNRGREIVSGKGDTIKTPYKIIALAKKVGTTLEDLNDLTTQSFFDILGAYISGENGGKDDEVVYRGSGADFDEFF